MPALQPRKFRRLARAAVTLAAALAAATSAAAGENHSITQRSLGGAALGMTQRDYARVLGPLHFSTRFTGGLTRLEYRKGKVHVFLSRASHRGVGLFTAADDFRTAAGVGPCSAVTKLQ